VIGRAGKGAMSRTHRATIGFATSIAQLIAQLGSAALLSPLVLHYAGQSTLGAYGVLMQAVGYLWLMDFGFGVALGRTLSQSAGRPETAEEFRRSAGTGLAFYAVSNALVAFAAVAVAAMAEQLLSVDAAMLPATRTALYVIAAWALLRTPLTIYGTALIAIQELGRANTAVTTGTLIRLVLSVTTLMLGGGLVGLVFAQVVSEGTAGLLHRHYYLQSPDRPPLRVRDAHWKTFTGMFSFGTQYLLASITTRLVYSTDQLIVAHQGGLTAAAIYYTTQMPTFILIQMVWRIADSAAPALNELYARASHAALVASLLRVGRYSLVCASGVAVGVLMFNREVIVRWVGAAQYAGPTMTTALAVFAILSIVNHLLWLVLVAFGRVRWMSLGGFALGVANVGLSIVLGRRYGIGGVMVASAIAEGVGLAIFLPYVLRLLKVPGATVVRAAIVPAVMACALVLPVILLALLPSAWRPPAPLLLLLFLGLFTLGAWRFGVLPDERLSLLRSLGRARRAS
jgi:O-antigen/teichoic acid export membrane protein